MIPLPLLDGDTLVIDNSSLELFQTCPRSALYGLCLRRRSTADRWALTFGGIAHKVLDIRYRSGTPMLEQTAMVQNDMIACAEREFRGHDVPPDEHRNLDRMIDLIDRYGKQYPYEPFDLVTLTNDIPFVEQPFALPFGEVDVNADMIIQGLVRCPDGTIKAEGEPYRKYLKTLRIVWCGRIDLAYTINGGVYILDHKTASIATNMAEFAISHQFSGYTWATEELLGVKVSGVVINRMVVRRPTVKGKGEPFAFDRQVFPVQRGLVQEWKDDVLHMIADFVEMVRRQYLPKHTAWCVGKFGTCQFHKVCTLGDEANALSAQRRIILDSGEYEENTWSPLAN